MRDQTLTKTDSFAIEDILDDEDITEATKETLRQLCTIDFDNDGFIFPEASFGNDRFETQHIPSSTRNDDDDNGIRDLSQESIDRTIEARQDDNDGDRNDDEVLFVGVRQSSCSFKTKPQQQYINHAVDEARDDHDNHDNHDNHDDKGAEDSGNEVVFLGTYRPSPHDPTLHPSHKQEQNHPINNEYSHDSKQQQQQHKLVLFHPQFFPAFQLVKDINDITDKLRKKNVVSPNVIQEPTELEQRRLYIQYVSQYRPTNPMMGLTQFTPRAVQKVDLWMQDSINQLESRLDDLKIERSRVRCARNSRDAIIRPRAVKKAVDLLDDMGQITQNTECHHHHHHHHHQHQQRRQLHERPMGVESSRPCKRRRITDDSEHPVAMEQPSLKELDNGLFDLLDEEQHKRHAGETDEQATNDLNDVNGHFIFEPSSILTQDDDLGISDDEVEEACFLDLRSCSWANED